MAAVRGVIDSEFNLALLYEAGRGVEKNLILAYEWYSIAGNAGDAQARERAVVLEKRLTPKELAAADQAVARFRPGQDLGETPEVVAPAATLAESQMMLARLGYYIGPTDGTETPEFKAAVAAYRRDHPAGGPVVAAAPSSSPGRRGEVQQF
jgi:localization factor PodJL